LQFSDAAALFGILKHAFELNMDALAACGMMPDAGSEQRLRFRGGFGVHPPFLKTRDQDGGVESAKLRLRQRRFKLSSKRTHFSVPGGESVECKYFTVKPPRRTNHKRDSRRESVLSPERGIIHRVVNVLFIRS
jgi:hypothetical protein